MDDNNKQKALAAALAQIEKQYGKGSIMKMDDAAIKDIDVVSTGSLGLDIALGVGGLPRGRVVEIYGPESSGKTTLTLQVIAEMQKIGGTAAFIDAENALDISYAAKLGVKTEDLLISQPDTGEQALEIADMLVRSGAVDVIVIDSVAALTPKAEIEGEMGEPQMGLQARLMSQALRKLTGNIKRTNTLVIFINQIRMKIGVMFGNPETTTGGNALKFYASVRMDIRRIGAIKKGDEVIGSETRVKVVKNKVAPPFRNAEFDILYGEGISREGEMLELGVIHGVVEKSGAWYIYNGDRLGQGKDNCREFLKENPAHGAGDRAEDPREGGRAQAGGGGSRSRRRGQQGRAAADAQAWLRKTQSDNVVELRARALRLLARREHTRAELERKLSPHAGSSEALDGLLSELKQKNQLSEERFAEERARRLSRKYGAARIRQDLKAKGVSEELIERVSSEDELRARARHSRAQVPRACGDARGTREAHALPAVARFFLRNNFQAPVGARRGLIVHLLARLFGREEVNEMNQTEALSVVRSLANGVDPETGEVFPADSVYQRAQTVRALYAAAEALEKAERFERRKQQLPPKTGEPWTEDEDRKLLSGFDAGRGPAGSRGRAPAHADRRARAAGEVRPARRVRRKELLRRPDAAGASFKIGGT